MGEEGTKITDDEHVTFLFYWLNAILFCSRSVQMSKLFLPLDTLLHEGKEEYQKQLEKVQVDKFKQIEALSIMDNKRAKLRSDLAKLVAP
ncbi:hypothetical protein Ahy_B03g065949 [Arachis hypogaea]|uniref:Uncharacterized protein n=1 Tax=Arachis hypogaea TaxID=3818 RepID=A0A445A2Q4_ARAHY|nr:hypothetical protein Ahy_B03g065949 [Arachis hypogaea]